MEEQHKKMKEMHSKSSLIGSRIRHYEYASEDYDRQRGKGSFFKKYPETEALLKSLYDEKVATENKITVCLMANDFEPEKESSEAEGPELGHH